MRYTTTHLRLLLPPEDGIVIDTPAMRELHLGSGCSHTTEPGCAVRSAIDAGILSEERVMAVRVAEELVAQGVGAIELCAGFGVEGAAMVKRAVEGKAAVGVVRFDNHPGFEFKSGDELFK